MRKQLEDINLDNRTGPLDSDHGSPSCRSL